MKLFRKIPPESIDPRLWKALLTLMRRTDSASAKLLAHVPTINLGVMELILTPHIRPALTPALLEEVAAEPKEKYRGAVAAMLRDTAAMKEELEDGRPRRLLGVCFLREAPERAIGSDRRAGKWGLPARRKPASPQLAIPGKPCQPPHMLVTRPVIFISAVSRELRSVRDVGFRFHGMACAALGNLSSPYTACSPRQ